MDKLLNSTEAAEYLSTSVYKMKRWIRMKLLKPYKIYGGNNALKFRVEDLDKFLADVTEEDKKKRKKYVMVNRRKKRKRRWWKKPEPKPKKKIYHIVLINHNKQLEDLYQATTLEQVYNKFHSMIEENQKEIQFPVRYNVEKDEILESKYELIIIKQKDETDSSITMLQDDYGKYVEFDTNTENWIVYDKQPYDKEETFWVYGYHPKLQRKTFQWIIDNFILLGSGDKYQFRIVNVFKNKLLIDIAGELHMVICKNKSDCIRLYNQIEEWCLSHKLKYITFGIDIGYSSQKEIYIKRIEELTGWNRKKIGRNSTRP